MKKEVREVLERQFTSEQIKQRKGNFGQTLDYIEGHEVINRLNEAFDGDWSFEIMFQNILEHEVLVTAKLTAGNVSKEQFGSSKITRNTETNGVVSLGDDLKAAATDALKKCSTLLGVGLHLYRNDHPATNTSRNTNSKDSGSTNKGNGGNGNGRATDKQLKAIFAIASDKGIPTKEVRDLCVDTFGKTPDYLSKEEASKVIQELSAR